MRRSLLRMAILLVFCTPAARAAGLESWKQVAPDVSYEANTLFRLHPTGEIGVLVDVRNFFQRDPIHHFVITCATRRAHGGFLLTDTGELMFAVPFKLNDPMPDDVQMKLAPVVAAVCPLADNLRRVTLPTGGASLQLMNFRANPVAFRSLF